MKKRSESPRAGRDARPSAGGDNSFRKSSGAAGSGRPFKRAKPETESRFSKPSIKKSSLRYSKTENTGQKARPDFSHEKPESFKPRSFRDRKEGGQDDRKPFRTDKPSFRESGRSKGFGRSYPDKDRPSEGGADDRKPFAHTEKPSFRESGRSQGFGRNNPDRDRPSEGGADDRKPFARTEKPSFRESGRSQGFGRNSPDRDRPSEGGADDRKPFARTEKPSFRESGRSQGFGKGKPDSDRPFGFRQKDDFKKKDASEREPRPAFHEKNRDEEQQDTSGLERRVGRYKSAPGYDFSNYEKRTGKKVKEEPGDIRLNRYIANAGICSRREADDLISSGQISVNGKTITEMGYKVKPADIVKYGKRALNPEKMVYILINKPKDYITTTEDPEERRTVLDLIKGACSERVYPVGRLDRNTTGLLLLTNDGELAGKLTHPSSGTAKLYQAELDKPITTEDFEHLQKGVELEDGFIRPDEVGLVTPDAMVVGLEIHSGRNRVVRRIFEQLGYEVQKLDRTVFAGLNKKDLPRGKWRFLTEKEVIRLKYMI